MVPRFSISLLLPLLLPFASSFNIFGPSAPSPPLQPPKYFFVYSDLYSGAEYITELIKSNVHPHDLTDCSSISRIDKERPDLHPHAYYHPDVQLLNGAGKDNQGKSGSNPYTTFLRNDYIDSKSLLKMSCPVSQTLFIHVTKDPYSWLVSMSGRKFHHDKSDNYGTQSGIRRSWVKSFSRGKWVQSDFGTGVRPKDFPNPMKMRTEKIKSQRSLKDMNGIEYFAAVMYESFVEDPKKALGKLFEEYGIHYKEGGHHFRDVHHHTNGIEKADRRRSFTKRGYYSKKEYLSMFDAELMDFVSRNLDGKLEKELGYQVPADDHKHLFHNSSPSNSSGLFWTLWSLLSSLVSVLIVLSLCGILVGIPLAIWFARSDEAKRLVEEGDGVNAVIEEVLEDGWEEAVDVNTGAVYYFNQTTRAVTWEKPVKKKIVIVDENRGDVLNGVGVDGEGNARDEMDRAFDDALFSVAHEKVREQELEGEFIDDRGAMVRDIADKLRKRYQKKDRGFGGVGY